MSDEIKALQGTWRITSVEIDGKSLPQGFLTGASITIDGDKFTTTSMGAEYNGTFTTGLSGALKTIDMKFATGPEKGHTSLGIYELDGDKWKLCLTITGKTRPAKFETSPKSGLALETLEREYSKNKVVADLYAKGGAFDSIAVVPVPELEGEWTMVSGTRGGEPMDKMMVSSGRRISKNAEVKVSFGGQVYIHAKYTVDTSKKPCQIDYFHLSGMYAGQRQEGIYALVGSRLTLISAEVGRARPTDFTTAVGDGQTLTVWKKK